MPRKLKSQKLDTYRHRKYGVSVDLMLDRNTHDFFFELGGTVFRADSMPQLIQRACKAIEDSHELTWLPMITVTRLEPFACRSNAFVGFEYERSWIARKADGKWLQCGWDIYHAHPGEAVRWSSEFYTGREVGNSAEFKLPSFGNGSFRDDFKQFYLPYTEELWAGLELIVEKIKILRKRLDDLMMTEEGLARLSSLATGLLLGVGELEE